MTVKWAKDQWGRGQHPLLLLHGFTGAARSWRVLEPHLAEHVNALAVDLPGHHHTPLPKQQGEVGFVATVDALADLMASAGMAPATVCGYSQGGRLALALACRHPKMVSALLLESANAGLSTLAQREARALADEALAVRLEQQSLPTWLDEWERQPLLRSALDLPAPVVARVREIRLAHEGRGLAGALRTLGLAVQPDHWGLLPFLACPTLIITGAQDSKYTTLGEAMGALLPNATHHVLPCGHAAHLEETQRYAQHLLQLIRSSQTRISARII